MIQDHLFGYDGTIYSKKRLIPAINRAILVLRYICIPTCTSLSIHYTIELRVGANIC